MDANSASPQPAAPWKRALISFVLLFHFIAVPYTSNLMATPRPPEWVIAIQRYVVTMRLAQQWALFSPEPRRFGLRYHAVLTYQNGAQKIWTRPKAPNWGFFARHLVYNFQKWDLVSNNLDKPMVLWPGLVNYLKRAYRDDFNPLQKIELYREHTDWPEPSPVGYVGPDIENAQWKKNLLFTYWVELKKWDYREYTSF